LTTTLVYLDVDKTVANILNESQNLHLRALKLYELQLAIIRSEQPVARKKGGDEKLSGPNENRPNGFAIVIPKAFLARARAYACMKLLQNIEDKHARVEVGFKLEALLNVASYSELLEYGVTNECWRWALATSRVDKFQERIFEARFRARQTSKLIAFSVRFETLSDFPMKLGGVNTVRKILCGLDKSRNPDLENFRPHRSESSLKTYWKGHAFVAALIYLAYFEKTNCFAPLISMIRILPSDYCTAPIHRGIEKMFRTPQRARCEAQALSRL
jgi:hypothetical protein